MPGWHEATRGPREQRKLRTLGIIQEQHPERARLFMQWKQMDWPVLVDALDLLQVSVVPITLLIDEHGVIREVVGFRDDPARVAERFLTRKFEPPDAPRGRAAQADLTTLDKRARQGSGADWRA